MNVGTTNLTSAGASDMFIARYTTDGTYDGAAIRIGGSNPEVAPPGTVRCDAAGNVYMTGRFRGTIDLDPGTGVTSVANPTAADNIWISSYTGALTFRWGFSLVSNGGLDGAHRVAFDGQGNLFVAGWFAGSSTDFDGGAGSYILASTNSAVGTASDTFIAKYNKDTGAFLWARGFGGTVTDQTQLSITAGLGVDADGCAYVTGQFYGTGAGHYCATGPLTAAPSWNSTGLNDGYIIKYDSDGNLWIPFEITAISQTNGMFGITWTPHPAVRLQRTTNLVEASWQDVPDTLGAETYSEPLTNPAAFFRLARPVP